MISEATLWIIESFVGGVILGAIIIMIVWAWDIKDRTKKSDEQVAEAYDKGCVDGYNVGSKFRFRERCQIERRCRQLEKQIQEMGHED